MDTQTVAGRDSFRAALQAQWPSHRTSIVTAALTSATLGLAPYFPHAHVYKQLVNLWRGQLSAPIDIFDLVLHGAPWIWLLWALARWLLAARRASTAAQLR